MAPDDEANMTDQPSEVSAPTAPRPSAGGSGQRAARSHTALYGFLGGLIGGLAAAAIVVGVIGASWPTLRTHLMPVSDTKPPALDDLTRRVAALEEAAGRPTPPDPALSQLAQRVAALERTPHESAEDPRIAPLVAKTDQLADQVAALHAASGDTAEMERQVVRAETAAQSAHDSAARRQSAEALLLVAGQLRDAVERGGPYAVELAAARKVAPASAAPALDSLASTAETGVARRETLAEQFPEIASAIARATLVPSEGDDLWSRLKREAAKLVSIRRVDGAGDDPMSIAARAEKALKAGNLADAVKELQTLSGEPAEAAKAWLAAAQARLAAERGLADLAAATATALSASDG